MCPHWLNRNRNKHSRLLTHKDDEVKLLSASTLRSSSTSFESIESDKDEPLGTTVAVEKRDKRVRFKKSLNSCEKVAANRNHLELCWYGPEDYFKFKTTTGLFIEKFSHDTGEFDCFYRRVLASAFTSCCNDQIISDESVEHSNGFSSPSLCSRDAVDLQKCMARAQSRLGVEHLIVPHIANDMIVRRSLLNKTVFQGAENATMPLRAAAISRPSCLFALVKAHALAVDVASSCRQ